MAFGWPRENDAPLVCTLPIAHSNTIATTAPQKPSYVFVGQQGTK
jgi:predicted metal-binding protein